MNKKIIGMRNWKEWRRIEKKKEKKIVNEERRDTVWETERERWEGKSKINKRQFDVSL